jgi:hypothetical protein
MKSAQPHPRDAQVRHVVRRAGICRRIGFEPVEQLDRFRLASEVHLQLGLDHHGPGLPGHGLARAADLS